jgi:hypothetical protein
MRLSLASLQDFNFGKAAAMFQQALKAVVADMADRIDDKAARKITLVTIITPQTVEKGELVDAQVEFQASHEVPKLRTAPRPVLVGRQGDLIFNADAPDNPRQDTFEMGRPGTDEE